MMNRLFLFLCCATYFTCASLDSEFPGARTKDCRGTWEEDCLAVCGEQGVAVQTFHVTQPAQNGGMPCPHVDGFTRKSFCSGLPCPVDCLGTWSEWSCNARCGQEGMMFRYYHIVQAGTNGGRACELEDMAMVEGPLCAGPPCADSESDELDGRTRAFSQFSFRIYLQPTNLSSFQLSPFLHLFSLFFPFSTYSVSSFPGPQFGLYLLLSPLSSSTTAITTPTQTHPFSNFNETLKKLNQSQRLYEYLTLSAQEKEKEKQDVRIRQAPLFWMMGVGLSDLQQEEGAIVISESVMTPSSSGSGELGVELGGELGGGEMDLDSMMDSIIHAYDTKCKAPPPMTYTDSVAVLVTLIVCGGAYFWVKFINSLSHSEDSSTPLVWVIFTLVMTFGSFMVLLIAEALPNWSRLTPGATFSPWKICPDDTPCLSTIDYGCPISTNAGGETLAVIRVTSVIAVLSLAAASIVMILAAMPKFFRFAPHLLIAVQYTSLIGSIASLMTWGLWASYSVDVIGTLPGNLSFGSALILNLAGFCGAVCSAYFGAYSRKAILNKIAKNAARSQDEARNGSSVVPLVATNQIPSTSDTTSPQSES